MEGQDGQAPGAHPLTGAAPVVVTDALVVGAGPAGLFQAFELGLVEARCHIVDALPRAGGQCAELYGDKPIYDIPALPRTTGDELVERLLAQLSPFDVPFHFGSPVADLRPRADGRFDVATAAGVRFDAGAVVIAGGVGAFLPRRLRVPGLEALRGLSVVDALPDASDGALRGRRVVVAGSDGAAVATARTARGAGAEVVLLHRRDDFPHDGLALEIGVPESAEDGRIVLMTPDGGTRTLAFDLLVERLGLSPRLGPIAGWGLAMERKALVVDTERFETSQRGIHAIGDVCTYPGKQKVILSAFHEATLVAFAIAPRPLEYTTTSRRLHRLLGVGTP